MEKELFTHDLMVDKLEELEEEESKKIIHQKLETYYKTQNFNVNFSFSLGCSTYVDFVVDGFKFYYVFMHNGHYVSNENKYVDAHRLYFCDKPDVLKPFLDTNTKSLSFFNI